MHVQIANILFEHKAGISNYSIIMILFTQFYCVLVLASVIMEWSFSKIFTECFIYEKIEELKPGMIFCLTDNCFIIKLFNIPNIIYHRNFFISFYIESLYRESISLLRKKM